MSQSPTSPGLRRSVVDHLSHPLKLRFVLCTATILAWQGLFFSPLSEQVAATTARIAQQRKREVTAREIEHIKKALAPHRDLFGPGDDVHELIRHLMGRIRSSPLRLIDLKPEKPRDLGPFVAIGLHLSLEGAYTDIDEFLNWTEACKRLLRIDTIRLIPSARAPGRLSANLMLLALTEKAAPAAKKKAEPPKSK